jgi:tetratricopeptide (TPR) repeat protein
MRNLIVLSIIFASLLVLAGCPAKKAEEKENDYERVLPPTPDVTEESGFEERPQENIDDLRNAVEADPGDVFARFDLLNALERSDMTDEALGQARALGALEEGNPFRAVAYLKLARLVLDKMPADAPNRAELVQEAIDGLGTALVLEPSNIPAHEALGRLALEKGDNDSALNHLAIALSVTEIGYELRIRMAQIYIDQGDKEKARAHLEAAKPLAEEAQDNEAVREIERLMSQID